MANGRQAQHSLPSEDMTMNNTQPEPKPALPLPASSPDDLWQMVLGDLRNQMTKATFNNWLGDSSVLMSASSPVFLIVVVRNAYAWEWLTYRLRPVVARTVVSLAEGKVTVCFIPRTSPILGNDDQFVRRPLSTICFDFTWSLLRMARLRSRK